MSKNGRTWRSEVREWWVECQGGCCKVLRQQLVAATRTWQRKFAENCSLNARAVRRLTLSARILRIRDIWQARVLPERSMFIQMAKFAFTVLANFTVATAIAVTPHTHTHMHAHTITYKYVGILRPFQSSFVCTILHIYEYTHK